MLQDFDTLELQNREERKKWAESIAAHPIENVQQRMYAAFKNVLDSCI